ncbi:MULTISPECIES: multidrug effflux MFS transporter [Arthrobacter]|uniref:Multidrug effflux MFS transporter n=3 Tax=Arthrobacter TaxID=1663 RepID=A0ABU9KPP7_9MICC|nr:multidrug effflux MFS transporter [Arthrobacter sp. YJM1]MDP5228250.1 multidrug effflux MFS transporter [Arthrobacter sp. YJM1]
MPRRQKITYVLILGALTALGPFTIDLYLPAFPAIQRDLGVGQAAVQLTLTGTTVGFALGQLFVGPLSDKVGRKAPLICATALHILASLGASFSHDIVLLGVFRVLMGIGAAGSGVVSMAMVRDLFSGFAMVRMFAAMALVNGLAPVLAPVIGSQLLLLTAWPGIFDFLAGYGALVMVACLFLVRETLPPEKRSTGGTGVLANYRILFRDRIFVGILVMAGMNFAGLFAYLSASPFLFEKLYGFTPQQYGLLFGINSLGIVAGVQTSSRLIRRVGPQWILAVATVGQVLAALAIIITTLAGGGLPGLAIPLWFYILCTGFCFPCNQVLALVPHGERAGTAASLLGVSTFLTAGLLSPVVGLLGTGSAVPMAGVMISCIGVGILSLWLVVRPRTVPPLA